MPDSHHGGPPVNRRIFLGAATATVVLTASATGAAATPPDPVSARRGRGNGRHRDLLVRGATVLTMDPELGDLGEADVLIRDGGIVAVGRGLAARGATVIDARGMIALPGLVDTHWHMWTGLGRAITTGAGGGGYLDLLTGLGPAYRPRDTYHATALSLAEALAAGITTVHDWSHNLRGPEWTDAALSAHAASGVRARLSYGGPQGQPKDRALDLAEVQRARTAWVDTGRASLTSLGAALRGPDVTPPAVLREEVDAARALGLPITMHAQPRANTGAIKKLAAEGLLGPDVQLVHAVYADARDRALMAESGTGLSVSPASELLFGWGAPQTTQMLDAGVGVSLSVDNTALAGQADLFEVMRLALGLGATARGKELGLDPLRVLRLATIDGATQLGFGNVTGSLTPGKRADLILVRTDTANTINAPDPVSTVVRCARPSDVDTVICDGRILKRHGDLTDADLRALGCAAARSLRQVRSRAGQ